MCVQTTPRTFARHVCSSLPLCGNSLLDHTGSSDAIWLHTHRPGFVHLLSRLDWILLVPASSFLQVPILCSPELTAPVAVEGKFDTVIVTKLLKFLRLFAPHSASHYSELLSVPPSQDCSTAEEEMAAALRRLCWPCSNMPSPTFFLA